MGKPTSALLTINWWIPLTKGQECGKRFHVMMSSYYYPDSKVHVANMGTTWVLSSPGGPHVPCYQLPICASFCFVIHLHDFTFIYSDRSPRMTYWPVFSRVAALVLDQLFDKTCHMTCSTAPGRWNIPEGYGWNQTVGQSTTRFDEARTVWIIVEV